MKPALTPSVIFVIVGLFVTPSFANTDKPWILQKDRWSESDEWAYATFVQKIGESNCAFTGACFDSPANPYRDRNPSFMKTIHSDCSRFPYLMRLYFAYMNNLPFSYTSKVKVVGRGGDVTQSAAGNTVVARQSVRAGTTLRKAISDMMKVTSSGMYRIAPQEDAKSKTIFPDFYPVALDRKSVRPGTLIYDPNGHVAMVYKVDSYGRVRFMDSHPDNSITRGTYGGRFARARSALGAGLKNWRPMLYTSDGSAAVGARNDQISDFSLIQYMGTHPSVDPEFEWRQNRFVKDEVEYDFYDYVRVMLADNKLRFEPLAETRDLMQGLCFDVTDRIASVWEAVGGKISEKDHPEFMPANIYGSSGEWGIFSTPSRDSRLKAAFVETQNKISHFLELANTDSKLLKYSGTPENLRQDILRVLEESYAACPISYRNSLGQDIPLKLYDIEVRLWDLSFDPYHCPELRWGARGEELDSCPDSAIKRKWYDAQSNFRALPHDEEIPEGSPVWTIEALRNDLIRRGQIQGATVDFRSLLNPKDIPQGPHDT